MIKNTRIGKYILYADDGAEMHESIRDVTGKTILEMGLKWEPHIWAEMERIKPKRFLDIGCNCGLYSIGVKDLVPDAEVISVDVSKQNCQLLMRSILQNKLEGMTVLNVALADRPRIIQIFRNPVNTVCNLNVEESESDTHWEYAFALPFSDFEISKLKFDLIKIDTDGFEYAILTGCPIWLWRCPIIFEYSTLLSRSGIQPETLIEWFLYRDYRITCLEFTPGARKECRTALELTDHMKANGMWITDILAEPI